MIYTPYRFSDFRRHLWQRFTNYVLSDQYRFLFFLSLVALACCIAMLYALLILIPPGIAGPHTYQGIQAAPVDTLHKKDTARHPQLSIGPNGIYRYVNGHTIKFDTNTKQWKFVK
jgi:hypothetical protein